MEFGLRKLAGIHAGIIKVEKTDKGYAFSNKNYLHPVNSASMKWVLREADINKNKRISFQEVSSLAEKMCNDFAE